jgi:hypothetical protein
MHLSRTADDEEAIPLVLRYTVGGGWFVKLNGEQHFLGKHPEDAQPPKKGRDGKWNPATVILDESYKLMALRDTASKSDYTLETICSLYLEGLEETNPALAKRPGCQLPQPGLVVP